MSKPSDGVGIIGVIGLTIFFIVAYPFIWLYEHVGGKLFLAIVIGVPSAIWWYVDWKKKQKSDGKPTLRWESEKQKKERKHREAEEFHAQNVQIIQEREQQAQREYFLKKHREKEQRKAEPTPARASNHQTNTFNNDPWRALCIEIEAAWDRGDYDWARQQLQKIAYGMVGESVSDEQRKSFTRLMTEFAKEDPLYRDVMERVIPLVQANPGMLQSQIYKGQPDHIKEQMRYVLYFANEIGHIKRIKKGNSYKLFSSDAV